MKIILWILFILLAIAVGIIIWFKLYQIPFTKWLQKYLSGVKISLVQAVGIHLKNVPFGLILDEYTKALKSGIAHDVTVEKLERLYLSRGDATKVVNELVKAHKAGLQEVTFDKLERHQLSHGDIAEVVDALIILKNAQDSVRNGGADEEMEHYLLGIKLPFERAAAIDLAGRDVRQDVKDSITPRLLESVDMEAITSDGFRVRTKVNIIVQAQVEFIIGRPGRDALIAKLEQAMITAIGILDKDIVIKRPNEVENNLKSNTDIFEEVDRDTSYKLVSVDVEKALLLENVNANFEIKKQELELKKMEILNKQKLLETELHHAHARSREQDLRNELIEARAKVQTAIADSLRDGKMTVDEYEKLRNLQADTQMRQNMANAPTDEDDVH